MPVITTPLETGRLVLRRFAETDLEALANIQARPNVMRYLYEEPRPRGQVAGVLNQWRTMHSLHVQGDKLILAIEVKQSGTMIGSVSLRWLSEEHGQGEIGYTLHPDHRGHGYASEAARAILAFGFEEIELHRIIGRCDTRNTPSKRLLERLGMRQEAHFVENEWFKGEWDSEYYYAILRSEWEVTRSREPLHSKSSPQETERQ